SMLSALSVYRRTIRRGLATAILAQGIDLQLTSFYHSYCFRFQVFLVRASGSYPMTFPSIYIDRYTKDVAFCSRLRQAQPFFKPLISVLLSPHKSAYRMPLDNIMLDLKFYPTMV